jgi:glutamate synthase (NADPH/NADH) large chain
VFDRYSTAPEPQGLYDPRTEKDACGVALVATLTGQASREVVAQALTALVNLEHRGASGSEPDSGDGAGILLQVPDELLRRVSGLELPPAGYYATGIGFLPAEELERAEVFERVQRNRR